MKQHCLHIPGNLEEHQFKIASLGILLLGACCENTICFPLQLNLWGKCKTNTVHEMCFVKPPDKQKNITGQVLGLLCLHSWVSKHC